MSRSYRALCMFAVIATAIAAPADARPTRVALAPIQRDEAGVTKAVAGALDDSELEVVSGKPVARAIDRLGLDAGLAERDAERLADALSVDAVVQGALDRTGHRLRFTIFSHGKAGKPVNVAVGKLDSDRFRKAVRNALIARITAATAAHRRSGDKVADEAAEAEAKPARKQARKTDEVAEADAKPAHKPAAKADEVAEAEAKPARKSAGKTADATDAEAKPAHKATHKTDEVAEVDAKPARKPASKTAEAAEAAEAAEPTDAEAKPARARVAARDDDSPSTEVRARGELAAPAAHTANLAAVRIDLGGSLAGRSLTFDTRGFTGAPAAYRNAPVPGARVAGELYPYAFVDPHSWLAGLGVAADYDRTLSLTLRASQEMTVPLAIAEQHYAFGLRYRLAFGHEPTSPTLTIGAGYSARRFAVNRTGLMAATSIDLPDVDYQMLDPGLAFRLPLGSRVAVSLAGQALVVRSAGPVQRPDQYGTATAFGGAASAAIELVIGERVALRLAAEATQINLQFTGNGTLATSRDGDSATIDVRGMTDRYYGGAATLAITY